MESALMEKRFKNQSGIIAPDLLASKTFTVIGAGAIGSFLVPTLAKMGAKNILVFDDDKIEDHNVANQFYPPSDTGEAKVVSLLSCVRMFAGQEMSYSEKRWVPGDSGIAGDFVVSCVDNMDTRRLVFDEAEKSRAVRYFVDGRMGALSMRTYCINLGRTVETDFYRKTLYSDAQAVEERCTEKSIIYTGLIVAGFMLNMIKRAVNGQPGPVEEVFDCVTASHVATRI